MGLLQAEIGMLRLHLALGCSFKMCTPTHHHIPLFKLPASLCQTLSRRDVFGLSREDAQTQVNVLLAGVSGRKTLYSVHGMEQRSLDILDGAILPTSVFQVWAL